MKRVSMAFLSQRVQFIDDSIVSALFIKPGMPYYGVAELCIEHVSTTLFYLQVGQQCILTQ